MRNSNDTGYVKAGGFLVGIIVLMIIGKTGLAQQILGKTTTQADIDRSKVLHERWVASHTYAYMRVKRWECNPYSDEDKAALRKSKNNQIWMDMYAEHSRDIDRQVLSKEEQLKYDDQVYNYDPTKCVKPPHLQGK